MSKFQWLQIAQIEPSKIQEEYPYVHQCFSCGNTSREKGFRGGVHDSPYSGREYWTECSACGSENTDEEGAGMPDCECGRTWDWYCDPCGMTCCSECFVWFPTPFGEPEEYECNQCYPLEFVDV